jgi:hypothetical protein
LAAAPLPPTLGGRHDIASQIQKETLMRTKKMSTLLGISIIAFLLVITAKESHALISIEKVSTERAKALGIDVRAKANGPKHVWLELEFKTEGELKHFSHVSMEISDGKEMLVGYAPMEAKRTNSGTVVVRFIASRAYLDKIALRIVEVEGLPTNMVGHDLPLRDFVDVENLR